MNNVDRLDKIYENRYSQKKYGQKNMDKYV